MADGADLFLSMPEDALTLIAAYLGHPCHFMSLCLTSRRLYHPLRSLSPAWQSLASSSAFNLSPSVLTSWHTLSSMSYLSICRFLFSTSRLHSSLWTHENPELGNLVVSLWGFLSLVFVRVVPQKVSGSLALSPVMEIHCDVDGAPTIFFLHGKDGSVHVGSLSSSAIPSDPTLLLLEADHFSPASSSENITSLHPSTFQDLEFDDRDWLLDFLSSKSAMKLPSDLRSTPIVPRSHDDFDILSRRREMLLSMHKAIRGGLIYCATIESSLCSSSTTSGGNESLDHGDVESSSSDDCENRDDPLIEYLRTGNGDSVGLSLRATNTQLSFYWSWPYMHKNCFGLYKLPVIEPQAGKELSGLLGGSYGWPPTLPGHDIDDESGKSMILLLLSYHETREGLILVGTKILQNYASYPIGSSMFTAYLDQEPSTDAFPWETTEMEVECGFRGEGISNGYGFQYPGSKPGTLFYLNNGLLAFVWGESDTVLTLERIDLAAMVAAKGEQVPVVLSAVSNFTFMNRSYSNVYTDERFQVRRDRMPRTRQERKRGPTKRRGLIGLDPERFGPIYPGN